jgi:dipeptidase D
MEMYNMLKISDDYFGPKAVYDHFMAITKLSHPSGDEDTVRNYVAECARKIDNVTTTFYEPKAKTPGKRVIVLRRPGSGKYSNASYVTLQAHMDMVCYPNNDIFPLQVFDYDIEGEKWIKAGEEESISDPDKGTTLGADDGIGVAIALAILEDENLKEYPIECLFTVQEETNMGGAEGFDKGLLWGRKYINLDAEDESIIIYGSAGGCNVEYEGTVERSEMEDKCVALKVCIYGLRGGHSGIDINKGRLNAIKALTEVLIRLNERITNFNENFRLNALKDVAEEDIASYDLRLVSMKRDEDTKMNSIPGSASAVVVIPHDKEDGFKRDLDAYCNALQAYYKYVESGFKWDVKEDANGSDQPLDRISTDALLCLLRQIPHGVIRMISEKKNVMLVETSTNLAGIDICKDKVVIHASNRSSNDASMSALKNIQGSIGKCFNYSVEHSNGYPSWQPKEGSLLLEKAKLVYHSNYGDDCGATVIHAGLECSYIVQKYEDMDCISIGPTIIDPHSGGERLKASTVKQFYKAVTELIPKLFPDLHED